MSEGNKLIPPVAPMGWVKGGTPTSAHERQIAKQDFDAEQRRKLLDAQVGATQTGKLPDALRAPGMDGGPGVARMNSLRLGGRDHAAIVLGVRHPKDNQILDWITCELSAEPKPDGTQELVLVLACVRCIKTLGKHSQRSQMTIRQSNRMFWLDQRRAGEIWVNPKDKNEVYTLAGTITTNDWITCPNEGCGWRFKIDDSIVRCD
jgi:hypothetical protein